MIIDAHCHSYFGTVVEIEMLKMMANMFVATAQKMGRPVDADALVQRGLKLKLDETGEGMIESMDKAGIDLSLLLMVSMGKKGQEENRIAGEIARRYPDRVIALAGVDPRDPKGPDKLKQCFEEFGCRGLKYHADFGYDPSGPESYKLLEIVQANKGILVTHTGPLGGISRSSLSDVSRLADPLVDFPEIPIVAAHMGFINWRPWASLAAFHVNMYGDLAMWDEKAFGNYPFFCRELRDLIDCAGVNKVIFGTDDPHYSLLRSTKEWVELIRNLPSDAPEGIEFTTEEVDSILGGNAARLLGL